MLREALKEGNANPERRIYFQFPSPSDHQNHLIGQVWTRKQTKNKQTTTKTNGKTKRNKQKQTNKTLVETESPNSFFMP